MKESTTLNKLALMLTGQTVIMSDKELDLLAKFAVSNLIRSKPNEEQCGLIDRWQCWIGVAKWEDDECVITLNGTPIGHTLSREDALRVREWLISACLEEARKQPKQ